MIQTKSNPFRQLLPDDQKCVIGGRTTLERTSTTEAALRRNVTLLVSITSPLMRSLAPPCGYCVSTQNPPTTGIRKTWERFRGAMRFHPPGQRGYTNSCPTFYSKEIIPVDDTQPRATPEIVKDVLEAESAELIDGVIRAVKGSRVFFVDPDTGCYLGSFRRRVCEKSTKGSTSKKRKR